MPRWASRITLEITNIRCERLQSISEQDAIAEGVKNISPDGWLNYVNESLTTSATASFHSLWDSIYSHRPKLPQNQQSKRYARVLRWLTKHPPCAWADNPFVWVIEFRRITP
jgi:hypothetical protein